MAGPGMGLSCDDYCTTFLAVCTPIAMYSTTYTSKADCMTKCQPTTQDQLCCRAQHVNLARDAADGGASRTMHCGHSVGSNATCP